MSASAEATTSAVDIALAAAADVELGRIEPRPEKQSWSLWPDALQFLVALVATLKPRHVLEFGSGTSTRVLAWACAEYSPHAKVSSVDNDPRSSAVAAEALARQDQRCPVSMQVAPLVIRDCGGELLPVYALDPEKLATAQPPELVLVDGPPLLLGGREGTLYQLLGLVEAGAVIVLDDAGRREESEMLERWEASLGDAVEIRRLTSLTGGQAAIVVRQPLAGHRLWSHRLRVTAARIPELLAPGASFVLVDDGAYGDLLPSELRARPLVEWGAPEDDAQAIAELEAARRFADQIVFAWPGLWWLDYYQGFAAHLRANHRCAHADSRLVVFDLR